MQQSWLLLQQTSVWSFLDSWSELSQTQEHIFDSLTLSHTGHVFYVKFMSWGVAVDHYHFVIY